MGAMMMTSMAACGGDSSTSTRTLATIAVTPAQVSVPTSGTQQFTAVGKDSNGNVVSISPVWSVTGGAGTIDNSGNFTAGSATGAYPNAIVVTSGNVTGTASVTVTPLSTSVSGDYDLRSVDGKLPPDTVVQNDTLTVEFLNGLLSLNTDSSYVLRFHTRNTLRGVVSSDSSGSTGTYSVDGTDVTITNGTTHSTVAATASPSSTATSLTFTDGGLVFLFTR